jgi:hypothetical protein
VNGYNPGYHGLSDLRILKRMKSASPIHSVFADAGKHNGPETVRFIIFMRPSTLTEFALGSDHNVRCPEAVTRSNFVCANASNFLCLLVSDRLAS